MIVVVMGVCGCGKTTVGEALAAAMGWPFFDADGFHPPANVAKMAAGVPLSDDDRAPWLDRLAAEMGAIERAGGSAVLACSALKAAYRDRLAVAGDVRFVHLRGDRATIASRVAARTGHYMPAALVDSQFADLEPPVDAIDVDIVLPVADQVAAIRRRLEADR
jgi:carbohydrate kinase (thermoresistant glucokinase family)